MSAKPVLFSPLMDETNIDAVIQQEAPSQENADTGGGGGGTEGELLEHLGRSQG